ncbi:cupin domain-containing protein [uncultured Fusobacterium sp.]|uniref:cupin domain-containing protein n=1 Tax=uncultured Fusobacterium sp. TaxID=159267 RepID=UPI0025E5ECC2|nr:cupin domain-containing protein [uncultured Fusobacterium sp.]
MLEILKPDFEFGDERGKLVQLVHKKYNQVNIIESKTGFKRGGHYHKINKECFYVVSGAFELILKKDNKEEIYNFKKGDMFLINEFVTHDFIYKEDTILVSLYTNGVELENGDKDIFKGE